jgi:hypothetical protein
LRLKISLAISGHLDVNRTNPLEGEVPVIRAISMIRIVICSLIRLSSQKLRQFNLHHLGQILSHAVANIGAYEVKELFGLRLNFFEKADNFGYANFDFHGRFSFLTRGLIQPCI